MESKYYMYVLLCADGTFYGGFTNDVAKRVATHNAGKGAKYTKTRRPVKLLYHEEFETKSAALKAEYAINFIFKKPSFCSCLYYIHDDSKTP